MRYIAPGTGFTNLQQYLGLNQATAQRMGQQAGAQVQQAGQQAQSQIDTFQQNFQQMLEKAQGRAPGAAGGGAPPATSLRPGAASSALRAPGQGPPASAPNYGAGYNPYAAYANTDLSKITADRLSGMSGWTDALSGAQQAQESARQLGAGQGGLSVVLGRQAAPGYYGGRGRAIDAFATSQGGGADFDAISQQWRAIADAYGLADATSAGQVDALRAGRAGYEAEEAARLAAQPAPAAPAQRARPNFRERERERENSGGSTFRRRFV